jgi:8-oxo-dGTP pyrophosphatase MutT (NUDIX family)
MNEHYHRIGQGGKRYWGMRGAGILFTDGESILLLRRSDGARDERGQWGIPGGRTEQGETPIDTARRETKEEAGHVEGQRFAQFDEKDGKHSFTVFLYAVNKPFKVELSEEHDQAEWIPIDDLRKYNLHKEFDKNLPYYLKAINRHYGKNSFAEWMKLKKALTNE